MVTNRRFSGENPVHYYAISNGMKTYVYPWDETEPVIRTTFGDFEESSVDWEELKELIGADKARQGWEDEAVAPSSKDLMEFRKPEVENVRSLFKSVHNIIWKADKLNPSAAFFEFVKLMFVKMYQDRRIHSDDELSEMIHKHGRVPSSEVKFSVQWIESLEDSHENPVDALLFEDLVSQLEEDIQRGNKKRIFDEDESLRLSPGTIKEVVGKLENTDMWGIDEDLNGRLFETFLSATMRGQELGQYFTPRSIVDFTARLAKPEANKDHVDKVMDACCGTGGFLIETLTHMRQQVRNNPSLTSNEKERLIQKISNESIYGIDAGKEPKMAQIARINMYLHGDGGSRIYAMDALDKEVDERSAVSPEEQHNVREFRKDLEGDMEKFDVVLSNPPFSMNYSNDRSEEERILRQYDVGEYDYSGKYEGRTSLRSSVMFLERYHDIMEPGGEMLTVMDDSVLSGSSRSFSRDWLREHFIVKAVISLPGDAFQRVGARQKTSILYLKKKESPDEEQPAVFMEECTALGLEDKPQRTPESERKRAKRATEQEIEEVLEKYRRFEQGEDGPWAVEPEMIQDRLDVKFCRPHDNPAMELWEDDGVETKPVEDVVERIEEDVKPGESPNEKFTFLEVSYEGEPRRGDVKFGDDIGYSTVRTAEGGDIVISHINAVNGAICVLPKEMDDVVISKEYSILRVKDDADVDPLYLRILLRSPEFRAMLLSRSSGGGRHRVDWDALRDLQIPMIPLDEQQEYADDIRKADEMREEAERMEEEAVVEAEDDLGLRNEKAIDRLDAAGPPS
jgi:type I restriction enzyme M protein